MLNSLMIFAQNQYMTRSGQIDFFSSTPIEDIKAINQSVGSVLDVKTGDFVFEVLMKSFQFKNALMQEHFNEKYVESDDYPTATFYGKIQNITSISLNKDIEKPVIVSGTIKIHGVEQPIRAEGILKFQNNQIIASSSFILKPDDFQIKIPSVVRKNIAKEIIINVNIKLNPM